MQVDTDQMKIARRLNGGLINGYAGFFTEHVEDGQSSLIIVIPQNGEAVRRLMREIDIEG